MSAVAYSTWMLADGDRFEPAAQLSTDGSRVIASIMVEPSGGRMCAQTCDPGVLRQMAAALIEAADLADALLLELVGVS